MPRLPRPRPAPVIGLLAALALAIGCRTAPPSVARYDPAHDLGPLFQDVQLAGIFPDSKTFVDARPLQAPAELAGRYPAARDSAGFNLRRFVEQNFELPRPVGEGFHADTARTMEDHIRALWPVLTRRPDTADARSSLIPLPQPYVVPGGRFREVYYWDWYFRLPGLIASRRAAARVVSPGLRAGADAAASGARGVLPERPGHGRERLGLLEPLAARPERPAYAGDDGAAPGRSQLPPLLRRRDDRWVATLPR